jgi:small subunit ribosomal protein S3Ae
MAKKSITGWKQKKTYELVAPDYFESKTLGETIASDPEKLAGRTILANVKDLTGDRTKQHIGLVFEVSDVSGSKAHTRFKEFIVSSAYMKSRVRKGIKKIDYIGDLALADKKVRVKIIVAARDTATMENKKEIRSIIKNTLDSHANDPIDKFVQAIVFGKVGTDIYHKIKKITSISRVEIQQVKIIG